MELRTKFLGPQPPKKQIINAYTAFLISKKKEQGKGKIVLRDAQKQFKKLEEGNKLAKYQRMAEEAEFKYNEELFHYNNKIQGKPMQAYTQPAYIPPKPKRPQAAFFNYFDDMKNFYLDKKEQDRTSYKDMIKMVSLDFNSLSIKHKIPYEEKYQKELNEYQDELKKWNDKYGEMQLTKKTSSNSLIRQARTKQIEKQNQNISHPNKVLNIPKVIRRRKVEQSIDRNISSSTNSERQCSLSKSKNLIQDGINQTVLIEQIEQETEQTKSEVEQMELEPEQMELEPEKIKIEIKQENKRDDLPKIKKIIQLQPRMIIKTPNKVKDGQSIQLNIVKYTSSSQQNNVKDISSSQLNKNIDVPSSQLNQVKDISSSQQNKNKDISSSQLNYVKDISSSQLNKNKDISSSQINQVKDISSSQLNKIKDISSSQLNQVKDISSSILNKEKDISISQVDEVKDTSSSQLNIEKDISSSQLDQVKDISSSQLNNDQDIPSQQNSYEIRNQPINNIASIKKQFNPAVNKRNVRTISAPTASERNKQKQTLLSAFDLQMKPPTTKLQPLSEQKNKAQSQMNEGALISSKSKNQLKIIVNSSKGKTIVKEQD